VIAMKHLSPEQLLDVVEGTASPERAGHAASCGVCRRKAEALQDALSLAGADPVPEPPPFFRERLAARVSEALRQERTGSAWWRSRRWQWVPSALALVLVVAGVGVAVRHDRGAGAPGAGGAAAVLAPVPGSPEGPEGAALVDDPSWSLVSDLSADMTLDDVESAGGLPAAGGIDRALLQFDDAERSELAKIIRAELAGPVPGGRENPGA
jgi:hypothetical protein